MVDLVCISILLFTKVKTPDKKQIESENYSYIQMN